MVRRLLRLATTPLLAAALPVLALAGCDRPSAAKTDESKSSPDPTPGPSAAPTPAAVSLALGDAKIMREGHADRPIAITSAGVVTLAGTPFGTVTADGRLLDPSGVTLMTVGADGLVDGGVDGSEGPTGMRIDETGGTLETAKLQVTVRIAADGGVEVKAEGAHAQLLGTDAPQLLSEGCTGAMVRTCALVTLSYLRALGNPDSVRTDDAP